MCTLDDEVSSRFDVQLITDWPVFRRSVILGCVLHPVTVYVSEVVRNFQKSEFTSMKVLYFFVRYLLMYSPWLVLRSSRIDTLRFCQRALPLLVCCHGLSGILIQNWQRFLQAYGNLNQHGNLYALCVLSVSLTYETRLCKSNVSFSFLYRCKS